MCKRILVILFTLFITIGFLIGCKNKPQEESVILPELTAYPVSEELEVEISPEVENLEPEWWKDRVFYEIFVRSFKDSNGDGIGDFKGIIEKLDYLNDGDPDTKNDLGVGGIWLMPINPSPSYHGYDVTDYYAVNPDYGTMDDFRQLLAEADKRDIKIIIDLVVNHTSTEHPWFKESRDPASVYHDWYVWSDTDPKTIGPWGQSVWHRNASNGMFYYGVFWGGMPDLNYDNPDVSAEMMNISKYWLEEVGVDGFRVDAARYLFAEGYAQQDTPSTITWFKEWRDFYKNINPEAFTVGEVWTDLQVIARYAGGLDSLFMFDLADDIVNGIYSPSPARIIESYQDVLSFFPDNDFSTFLSNHDQKRVMNVYGGNLDKAKLAAYVYLTGPGIPFIYYGEEIGMTGNKPDELIRTPMQWTAEQNSGFTEGSAWQKVNGDYSEINVASQDIDPDSLLNFYRDMVTLRKEHPALVFGEYLPIKSSCRMLYPVLRIHEEEVLLIFGNLGKIIQENCMLSLETSPLIGDYSLSLLYGQADFPVMAFGEGGSLTTYTIPWTVMPGELYVIQLNN